jgi:predicted nucleotidyltransferase
LEEELMLTVEEAFRKFKTRLELNDKEQKNASARHYEVRDYLATKFAIDRSFLTGSYARHTKTKPLKDIDIFFVLKEAEKHYRSKTPSAVIGDFHDALVEKYGEKAVRKQSRLHGGWQGRFDYEIQGFFSTLADRVFEEWPDPAGLGPSISNGMDDARKRRARDLLTVASRDASLAIDHTRSGRNGEALKAWRALFGPKFPLS